MLKRYHEALGDRPEDPLPKNWKVIADNSGDMPERFGVVEQGRFYRSAMIWSHHISKLQKDYGIEHIVSLVDGDWLSNWYDDSGITIHQFPILRRRAFTKERVRDVVEAINSLDGPAIVHCLKGVTRTGMVSAAYQVLNGYKGNLRALFDYVWKSRFHVSGLLNFSTMKEILDY